MFRSRINENRKTVCHSLLSFSRDQNDKYSLTDCIIMLLVAFHPTS